MKKYFVALGVMTFVLTNACEKRKAVEQTHAVNRNTPTPLIVTSSESFSGLLELYENLEKEVNRRVINPKIPSMKFRVVGKNQGNYFLLINHHGENFFIGEGVIDEHGNYYYFSKIEALEFLPRGLLSFCIKEGKHYGKPLSPENLSTLSQEKEIGDSNQVVCLTGGFYPHATPQKLKLQCTGCNHDKIDFESYELSNEPPHPAFPPPFKPPL